MKINNQRSVQKVRVCDIMPDEAEAQFKVTLNCVEWFNTNHLTIYVYNMRIFSMRLR